MLKRIVFILDKKDLAEDCRALFDEIRSHGAEIYVGDEHDMERIILEAEEDMEEETLYITDSAVCQRGLHEKGLTVIVYYHEDNRGEDFLQAEYAIEKIEEIEYESLELGYLRLAGKPWPILTTDRCFVRETTPEDLDSFYEIYKEPSITYYMEDLFADREEELAYIRNYIKNVYAFYGYGMWTVLEKSSGRVIGRAGIVWREGFDIPELGFVIGVPDQRQGYAYEVCQAILAYGKKELGFDCVQAIMMEENEKSKALCKKLGFKYEDKREVDGIQYDRMVWRAP